ncbi:hypothetical protein [Phascolarctobacterium sp.]|uniref:hypothetical protein n=1 Tax=Phascolarctobacterium sp. TaxID=2049039 RepID=UPI0030497842
MIKGDFWDMDKELDKIKQSLLDDVESYKKIYNDTENYEKFKKEIDTIQSKGYYFSIIFNGVFLVISVISFLEGIFDGRLLSIIVSIIGYWLFHRNMKQRAKKAYEEYESVEKYLQKQILRAKMESQVI